jgi:hypothetical protein
MNKTNLLLKYYLRTPEDFVITLGSQMQKGAIFAVVYSISLWKEVPLSQKILSVLKRRWSQSEELQRKVAEEILIADLFGTKEDYGDIMFNLMQWHNSYLWELDFLTQEDKDRSDSIVKFTVLTRTRFIGLHYIHLRLHLAQKCPFISLLVTPMLAKIPVIAIRYYVDIHFEFAVNSIRKSNHPMASDLISYLYEIIFIQQKLAISLHEYIRLADFTYKNKKDALLLNAETDTMREADNGIGYLKASLEKIISLIALTHEIQNLDDKKTHQAKLRALDSKLPEKVLSLYYWQFIRDFISSENLEELNNYRTGVMHKKGISKLQPHQYVGKSENELPFSSVFSFLHEQHSRNTAVLIAALAILTDDLVNRDPPTKEWQADFFQFAYNMAEMQLSSFPDELKKIEESGQAH